MRERPPETLEPLPARLLRQPLEYIQADHHRHRVACSLADRLAATVGPASELARGLAGFLARDMALHLVDEEQDLFPLLRRRARPEDELDAVLGQLSVEHEAEERQCRTLVEALLEAAAAESALEASTAAGLKAFAQAERQHIALENAVVMPLARLRLTASDQRALALRMAARRGIEL